MNPEGPTAGVINIYPSLAAALLCGANEPSLLLFDFPCQILHGAQLLCLPAESVPFSPQLPPGLVPLNSPRARERENAERLSLPGWGQMGGRVGVTEGLRELISELGIVLCLSGRPYRAAD